MCRCRLHNISTCLLAEEQAITSHHDDSLKNFSEEIVLPCLILKKTVCHDDKFQILTQDFLEG